MSGWKHNDHGTLDGRDDDDHSAYVPTDGSRQFTKVDVSGLAGATEASRYVGATTSGAPVSGTFAVGDFVVTQDGDVYVCTTAGSPGTWTQVGGSGGGTSLTTKGDIHGYDTGDARIPVGSDDQVLTADSAQSLGIKWATPSGGSGGGGFHNQAFDADYTLSPSPSGTFPETDRSSIDLDNDADFANDGGKLNDGERGQTGVAFNTTTHAAHYLGWENQTGVQARFDLGSAKTLDHAVIVGGYGDAGIQRPARIEVEHSDDDSAWTQVVEVSSLTDSGDISRIQHWIAIVDLSAAGSHRYWRFEFDSQTSQWVFLSEIELFGS